MGARCVPQLIIGIAIVAYACGTPYESTRTVPPADPEDGGPPSSIDGGSSIDSGTGDTGTPSTSSFMCNGTACTAPQGCCTTGGSALACRSCNGLNDVQLECLTPADCPGATCCMQTEMHSHCQPTCKALTDLILCDLQAPGTTCGSFKCNRAKCSGNPAPFALCNRGGTSSVKNCEF